MSRTVMVCPRCDHNLAAKVYAEGMPRSLYCPGCGRYIETGDVRLKRNFTIGRGQTEAAAPGHASGPLGANFVQAIPSLAEVSRFTWQPGDGTVESSGQLVVPNTSLSPTGVGLIVVAHSCSANEYLDTTTGPGPQDGASTGNGFAQPLMTSALVTGYSVGGCVIAVRLPQTDYFHTSHYFSGGLPLYGVCSILAFTNIVSTNTSPVWDVMSGDLNGADREVATQTVSCPPTSTTNYPSELVVSIILASGAFADTQEPTDTPDGAPLWSSASLCPAAPNSAATIFAFQRPVTAIGQYGFATSLYATADFFATTAAFRSSV